MKLSKAQKELLALLRDGWELGSSSTMDSRCWVQKGGIGRGGDYKDVGHNTLNALYARKLITQHYAFPSSTYELTELGRTVLLD